MKSSRNIAIFLMAPFALIGLVWVGGTFAFDPMARLLVGLAGGYNESYGPPHVSPNGQFVVRTLLVQGGFGTVWDERLVVHKSEVDPKLHRAVLAYSDRDLEFSFRWNATGDLEIDVSCGRYEHASNSIDEGSDGNSLGWVILQNANQNCVSEGSD